MRKQTTKTRLKAYTALAGATLAGVAASAQVTYTDLDDVTLTNLGDFYDLDLNNDGEADFSLGIVEKEVWKNNNGSYGYGAVIKGAMIKPLKYNDNRITSKYFKKGVYNAYANADSVGIRSFGKMGKYAATLRGVYNKFYSCASCTPEFSEFNFDSIGYFNTPVDKFIGMYVQNNQTGKRNYGWARVNVVTKQNGGFELTLKDYAFNTIGNAEIQTGIAANIEELPKVSNVVVSDINNTNTGNDLKVSWNAPVSEENISKYKVFIAKASAATINRVDELMVNSSLPVKSASNIGYYFEVDTAGIASYEVAFEEDMFDTDGDLIQTGVEYKAIVVAYNNEFYKNPSFQYSTNSVTLSVPSYVAENVVLVDTINTNSYTDFSVGFSKAADESNIQEYRILIFRDWDITNIDSSSVASASVYSKIYPNGSNQTNIKVRDKSYNNNYSIDPINSMYYQVIVVSVLKNGEGYVYSSPSNKSLLGYASDSTITDLVVQDISDNGNSSDMRLIFTIPENPANFGHNAIPFVVVPQGYEPSEIQLQNTTTFYHKTVKSKGEADTVNVPSNVKDIAGNYIKEGIKYKVYPVTPNGGKYSQRSVGTPVEILLTSPMGTISTVQVVVYNDQSPADWKVMCNGVSKEANVAEYRVMLVKVTDAASFDLAEAMAVDAANYTVIKPAKSSTGFSQNLSANITDAYGNGIARNTPYQVFVLAYGNTKSSDNLLSQPSNKVSLVSLTDVADSDIIADKIYTFNKTVSVELISTQAVAKIEIYSIQGALIYNGTVEPGVNTINLDSETEGMYIVNVTTDKEVIKEKVYIK